MVPETLLIALALVFGREGDARQSLENQLLGRSPEELAGASQKQGDPRRGAVIFYQASLACTRCHLPDDAQNQLGPDLAKMSADLSDEHLVDSILQPSKDIQEEFKSIELEVDGEWFSGLLVSEDPEEVVLRVPARNFKQLRFDRSLVTEYRDSTLSAMPTGLVNLLENEQQFFDLVSYLSEIRDGGSARAAELAPNPALYAARPLPDYEGDIDHAGFLRELDDHALERGREIYNRLCINCHGSPDAEGSLPTSLKFASEPFKNGSDPLSMYQTLTRGYGMMVAQTWMVPSQKYDVIHYIREAYLREANPSEYHEVDEQYLASLPRGESRGPAPVDTQAWQQMDYGPNQVMTLEIGDDGRNFAYKGNAIRLDAGPGGVAHGQHWMVYDHDTLRVAAAWSGDEFIDWRSIHFNGEHAIHPRLEGRLHLENPTGPGWGRGEDGSFEDTRMLGRDKRRYGPLPRDWAQYKGMYAHGPDTLIEYTVSGVSVLEMPGVLLDQHTPVFTRSFEIGPREDSLVLQVAHCGLEQSELRSEGHLAFIGALGRSEMDEAEPSTHRSASWFHGANFLEESGPTGIQPGSGDFTLTARVKTDQDGTLIALTSPGPQWIPDGLTWFIRDGRMTVDIGWVGDFQGERLVADASWHELAMTYVASSGEVRLFVDGRQEKTVGRLRRKAPLDDAVLRVGFTSEEFPAPSFLVGELSNATYFDQALEPRAVRAWMEGKRSGLPQPIARWALAEAKTDLVENLAGPHHPLRRVSSESGSSDDRSLVTVAGLEGDVASMQWEGDGSDLRLRIPAGDRTLRFTLWFATADDTSAAAALAEEVVIDRPTRSLRSQTRGGPPRWGQPLKSEALISADDGPFSVDVLKRPTENPWFCRLRLTGIDFTDNGDSAIVSAWDGSIWKVSGLAGLSTPQSFEHSESLPIEWRRIASGLFQPLGVKVLDGEIFITCRDQIVRLHDLNGDEEIDWYECFNNDHQVTDHFHEFAMGLQSDADGNLYYAKSARHALPALVPHHGTLLRVSSDGQDTKIIANGFRAANGVCLNPDGTFIVTDQEGHWNPKNRINHVREGGFYGNMLGYHDVTDSSDSKMEQPIVWITNSFDRSPAELLWVDSPAWGPLQGSLLNLSYGNGRVHVVALEELGGQIQGGLCALPINDFPTGVMRGRFHPVDGQLYLAGMFAWAGNQQQPGGLYRLRYTGKPVHLPIEMHASKQGIRLLFSGDLDPLQELSPANFRVQAWDLKRTASYGSAHHNERDWVVHAVGIGSDGRTVLLEIPDIAPSWGVSIKFELESAAGHPVTGEINSTIHVIE